MRWGSGCLAPREICACYIAHIYLLSTLTLTYPSYYLGVVPPHTYHTPPSTSGWFFQTTCHMRPFYLGLFFLVLFRKSTKNFGLAFLRVSGRRGCLKRPLRASNLFGVSVASPPSRHLPLKSRRPRLLSYTEVVSFRGTGRCCVGRCFTSAKYGVRVL